MPPKPETRKQNTYLALCLKPTDKNTKQNKKTKGLNTWGVNKQGSLRGEKAKVKFAQYGTFKLSDLLLLLHSYQIHIKNNIYSQKHAVWVGMCRASFTFWHRTKKNNTRWKDTLKKNKKRRPPTKRHSTDPPGRRSRRRLSNVRSLIHGVTMFQVGRCTAALIASATESSFYCISPIRQQYTDGK